MAKKEQAAHEHRKIHVRSNDGSVELQIQVRDSKISVVALTGTMSVSKSFAYPAVDIVTSES